MLHGENRCPHPAAARLCKALQLRLLLQGKHLQLQPVTAECILQGRAAGRRFTFRRMADGMESFLEHAA